MPKVPSRSRFLLIIGFLTFLFISLLVGLFLMKQNQDVRQKAYNGGAQDDCVKAGCYNQVCISREEDRKIISSVCDYQPIYECYKPAICERQNDGKCGFSPTPELERCLVHPPQPSFSPRPSATPRVGICQSNSDCPAGQICYKQPTPPCVNGNCPEVAQVMPYCKPAPATCTKDSSGKILCPYFDPAPGFCQGGEIVASANNECGCQMPPTCKYTNEISIGNQRPTDQQLYYRRVVVNQDPNVRMITTNEVPVKNEGNAMGFVFFAQKGQKLHILAKETDIQKYGSYIRTAFYGSNGNKLASGDTRISDFIVPSDGDYYLVVYTFRKVDAYFRLAIFEQNKLDISVSLVNDFTLEQTLPLYTGKAPQLAYAHPFIIAITLPNDAFLNSDNTVEWFDKLEGINMKIKPQVARFTDMNLLSQYFSSLAPITSFDLKLSQAGRYRIWIKDSNDAMWPESFHYLLRLQSIYQDSRLSGFHGQYAWSATVEENIGFCDFANNSCVAGYQCITPSSNCEIANQQTCAFIPHCEKVGERPSADLNGDGKVDIDDYSILKQELLKHLTYYRADLNRDGWVDLDDYSILKQQLSIF